MENLEAIAARLKAAREAAGFKTSRAFCEAFHIPRSTYSQHESGHFPMKDSVLKKYANSLEVNFDWLKFGEGEPLVAKHAERKVKLTTTLQKQALLNDLVEQRYALPTIDENLLEMIIEALSNYSNGRAKTLTAKQMAAACSHLYSHLRKVDNDPTLRTKMIHLSVETYFHLAKKKKA